MNARSNRRMIKLMQTLRHHGYRFFAGSQITGAEGV